MKPPTTLFLAACFESSVGLLHAQQTVEATNQSAASAEQSGQADLAKQLANRCSSSPASGNTSTHPTADPNGGCASA